MRALQLAVFGVVTGSFLVIATLGFSLIRQVEGFLNIAHVQLMSVAAFTTWFLNVELGVPFLLSGAISVGLVSLLGLVAARLFYDPMKPAGPLGVLITSVGVVFVLHGFLVASVGAGARRFQIPSPTSFSLGGIRVNSHQLIVVAVAIVLSLALATFLTKTRVGLTIRAMAFNRSLASSRGVDTTRASRAVWLVSSALAGMGGILLGVLGTLTTDLAFDQFLTILAVAILAGLGSLYSVIFAGLIVGLSMDLSLLILPGGWRPMVAFLIVIFVLIFRPTGLGKVQTR